MRYMIQRLRDRRRAAAAELEGAEAADQGFTLIELMVVLLIMGILLAIAIPTFLGARGSAQDRAAQSDLTNALTSAKAIYANTQSYPAGIAAALSKSEPSLKYVNGTVTPGTGSTVSTAVTSSVGQWIVFSAQSGDGICWAVKDTASGTGAGTTYAAWKHAGTNCAANTAGAAATANGGWKSKYPGTTTNLAS